jgi:aspartyl-tRNA(Asn)/glutamyl-tRNA(Gln) amidotransferase subunit A
MTEHSITRRDVIVGAATGAALSATRRAAAQRADLTKLSIADAGRRIAARDLSPVDLTRAYLERIEELNPRVNAYITVTADQALAQARSLEAEIAAGMNRGPLHGIPLGLKDNIDTAGIKTTAASAVYADRVPTEDAPVVQRLREAGAVFLGKLNMHEFAYGGTSAITHYGPVHNPWSLKHAPGGSSGGSAAAVAARMCAAALGTDTAASIRYPASVCGVVGLKATHGLASIRGIVPLSAMHDHVGPISRSVEDSAIVMTALAGFDPLDPVSIDAPREDHRRAIGSDVSGLRIGIPRSPFFDGLDPDIGAAVERAIEQLRGMTRSVSDASLPPVDSFAMLAAETYAYHKDLLADAERRKLYVPITLERILGGENVPAVDYIAARNRMIVARNTVAQHFADVDVLVTPTMMALPPEIAPALANAPGEPGMIRNTLPFDVYGIPAISVPCGFSRSGLPIGLQIGGPRLGEARVLALAHAYEQATDWHTREPPIR